MIRFRMTIYENGLEWFLSLRNWWEIVWGGLDMFKEGLYRCANERNQDKDLINL